MRTAIKIAQAKSNEELFYAKGVALALRFVFMNPKGILEADSLEYAQLARAYWAMPPNLLVTDNEQCNARKYRKLRKG